MSDAPGDPVDVIRRSRHFDAAWYARSYPDVALAGVDAALHYLKVGANLLRDPGPVFSTRDFYERHPVLRDRRVNPLLHVELSSRISQPTDHAFTHRPLYRAIGPSSLRVAVAVHVYYPELWPEIASRLQRLDAAFDLFVTMPSPQYEAFRHAIASQFPNARFFRVANLGMDLAPFLTLAPTLRASGYDIVFKLHTKRGSAEDGAIWRELALDSLIGSADTFQGLVEAFDKMPLLSMAGPAPLCLSARALMYTNGPMVEAVLAAAHVDPAKLRDWGFFAGTMFCARLALFTPARMQAFDAFSYETGRTGGDGTLAHSLERVICALPILDGGRHGLVHRKRMSRAGVHALEIADSRFHGIRNGSRNTLAQILRIAEHSEMIRRSPLFDAIWYARQRPIVGELGLDPAEHYLMFGERSGASPGPDFEPAAYRRDHPDFARTGKSPLLHYLTTGEQEQRIIRGSTVTESVSV